MSTKIGDDTDTVGNIEKFLQECLEGMEPDHKLKGPGKAAGSARNGSVGGTAGLRAERLWQPTGRVASYLGTRSVVLPPIPGYRPSGLQAAPYRREPSHWRVSSSRSAACWQNDCRVCSRRRLAPFAEDVVCIDESTLDTMSRTLPTLRGVPQGDSRLLPGKLSGVFDVRRQQWRICQVSAEPTSEREGVGARFSGGVAGGNTGGGRLGILRLRLV